jgi:hypothetical protein
LAEESSSRVSCSSFRTMLFIAAARKLVLRVDQHNVIRLWEAPINQRWDVRSTFKHSTSVTDQQ